MAVRMNLNKDYYAELGVALNGRSSSDIPKSEIKDAVKGLEALHGGEHKDLSPEQLAGKARRIEAIKEASAVLLDDKERAKYDRFKGFNTNAGTNAHSANDAPKGQNDAASSKPRANNYEVLGVDEKASPKEIKEAFDKTQNTVRKGESISAASQRLTAEQRAYRSLGHPEEREAYDKHLAASRTAPRGYFKVIGVSEDASPKEIDSKINEIKENAKLNGHKLSAAQKKAIEVVGNQDAREKYKSHLRGNPIAPGENYDDLHKNSKGKDVVSGQNNSPDGKQPDTVDKKKVETPKARGKMGFIIKAAIWAGGFIGADIALNKAQEYLFGDANASNKPSVPIANPEPAPANGKVDPVPNPEYDAYKKKQAEKQAQDAAKAVPPVASEAKGGTEAVSPLANPAKGEDGVREVQKGDTLTKIADSRDADMAKARKEVRAALGENADNKTVLGVLAIALAENNGKENINRIDVGDKLSISGDKIKEVVAALKDSGKLEGGRLALGNETTLTEIFAKAPNTPVAKASSAATI